MMLVRVTIAGYKCERGVWGSSKRGKEREEDQEG
jgi:hypothetical protein